MDERQDDVHERRSAEESVQQAKQPTEGEAAAVDRAEHREIDERENQSGEEMQGVAERLGAEAVGGERGAQKERQIHSGKAQLVGRPQRGGQDERADEAACDGTPDAHVVASAIAAAALISAKWTRAWGTLPRNSPLLGSISSA